MLTMPNRNGWMVAWYTGETKVIKYKNGHTKEIRMECEFTSRSKAEVEAKADALKSKGFEIKYITECIF